MAHHCSAGHPLLRDVIRSALANIECYVPGLHGVGAYGCWWVAGPIAYTSAIAPILHMHGHRLVEDNRDCGLIYSLFPDFEGHKALSDRHYMGLITSVVDVGPIAAAIFRPIMAGKRAIKKAIEKKFVSRRRAR